MERLGSSVRRIVLIGLANNKPLRHLEHEEALRENKVGSLKTTQTRRKTKGKNECYPKICE
jgi:hypothetical protein